MLPQWPCVVWATTLPSNGAAIADGVEQMVAEAAARAMAQIRLPIIGVLLGGQLIEPITCRLIGANCRVRFKLKPQAMAITVQKASLGICRVIAWYRKKAKTPAVITSNKIRSTCIDQPPAQKSGVVSVFCMLEQWPDKQATLMLIDAKSDLFRPNRLGEVSFATAALASRTARPSSPVSDRTELAISAHMR